MEKFLLAEFGSKRHYASIIQNPVQLLTEHIHDYYELTLIPSGSGMHHVNGHHEVLTTGCLSFIRPDDCHYYEPLTKNFHIINVIVPSDTIHSLFSYLGDGFEASRLLDAPLPPTVRMSLSTFQAVENELRQLILYKNLLGRKADALFHTTLLNLITRHFPMTFVHNRTNVPVWLQWLVLEMFKPEHYVEGVSAMPRLTGKTKEHICRSCHKHLGLTPTQLINDIRLRQAARRLVETPDPIIDICIETGFESLSNFYHIFKKTYGISPKAFRRLQNSSLIHEYTIVDSIFPQSIPTGETPKILSGGQTRSPAPI